MKNVFFKLVTTAAAASLVLAALPVSADEEAKEIKVAVAGGFYPITYADDNGEAQGYDVEVFKAVDELLPQYTFTYEITDKETMNVGVQSGTYQVGINCLRTMRELPLTICRKTTWVIRRLESSTEREKRSTALTMLSIRD